MSTPLLFCTAEEAKSFTRSVLNKEVEEVGTMFWLVESRNPLIEKNMAQLRPSLESDQNFETDFIGTTPQECQKWALEKAWACFNIDRNTIAIADAQSAKDNTLLLQYYCEKREPEDRLHFGSYGPLPPKTETWYGWRIRPENDNAWQAFCSLSEGDPAYVYPVFFGSPEKFTDEHGVFDVPEAKRFIGSEDEDVQQSDIFAWMKEEPSMQRDQQGNPV